MADTPVYFACPSGMSLSLSLFPEGSDAAGATDVAATEETNRLGMYAATISAAISGLQTAIIKDAVSSAVVATGWLELDDDTNRYYVADFGYSPGVNGGAIHVLDDVDAGGTGDGARTILVTVNDGANPLENAKIRLSEKYGAKSYVANTDVSGQRTFNVDDGTWVVAISKSNYDFEGAELVVTDDDTPVYSMTQTVFPSPEPGQVTGVARCFDNKGQAEPGVEVHCEMTVVAESNGYSYSTTKRTAVSNANGDASFTGMFIGGTFRIWRGDSKKTKFTVTIPANASDPFQLVSHLGAP